MITSAKYINYIVETINVLRQEIISKSSLGLTDDNKHLENFICDILNKVYDYNLKNLNEEKPNYPGIDLGDSTSGIGFQITSTKTSSKINETINKVIDENYQVYKTYKFLKFFILTNKQITYSVVKTDNKILFNWKEDILDFDDVYQKSMYLSLGEQKDLVEYIHQQLPYVAEQIGLDFFNPSIVKRLVVDLTKNGWKINDNRAEFLIEHNFGYIPNVSVMNTIGQVVLTGVRKDEKKVLIEIGCEFFEGKAILT